MKKRIIKLSETDLQKIIKRVIKENDDYNDRGMYETYYSDDEEYDEDEVEDEYNAASELNYLMEIAMDILVSEYGVSIDDLVRLTEYDIIDLLEDNNETELARDIQYYVDKFYVNPNEPYDAIGGLSPNDIKRAFDVKLKKMRKGK